MKCKLCPRRCGSDRTNTRNIDGYCQMPLLPVAARADLHFWEEPCISGTKGSGTVFFSGCSLKCIYCQNYGISHDRFGKTITIERLAVIFYELEQKGAHNINLVNPTHYALAIKDALNLYRPKIPIVYNSGGYERVETLKALEPYVDIYLMDYKYLSNQRAKLLSDAEDYPEVARDALLECYRQKKSILNNDGIMQTGVIVRHMILPRATNEAINIFDFVKENMPNAYFSLLSQYTPYGKVNELNEINRRITKREHEKVLTHICDSDFKNVFYQELSSADEGFIPLFDLSGI